VVEIKQTIFARKKQQLLGIFTNKTVSSICVQLSAALKRCQ